MTTKNSLLYVLKLSETFNLKKNNKKNNWYTTANITKLHKYDLAIQIIMYNN